MANCSEIKGDTDVRCADGVVTEVTVGCVHEHLTDGRMCQTHLSMIAKGDMGCWHCWQAEGANKHFCPVNVIAGATRA